MSQNIGTLVTAAIRPNDNLDLIASAYADEILGGLHSYETLAERDAIITARRNWGMLANVWNDGADTGTYQLVYGNVDTDITNNANWTTFNSGSSTSVFFQEAVSGTINSSNVTFTLSNNPTANSLTLYLGRQIQILGVDYTLSGSTITYTTAPNISLSGDHYAIYTTSATTWYQEAVTGTVNSSNVTFTLPHTPTSPNSLTLYLGRQIQIKGVDYTLSGTTITYTSPPDSSLSGDHYAIYQ